MVSRETSTKIYIMFKNKRNISQASLQSLHWHVPVDYRIVISFTIFILGVDMTL